MPSRLDDKKRHPQILLAIQTQDPPQFDMYGVECRGQDAQIQNARPTSAQEDEAAEIPISGHEEAALLLGGAKHFGVFGLCKSELGRGDNVVAQALQKADR